jgi:hypothetical protein
MRVLPELDPLLFMCCTKPRYDFEQIQSFCVPTLNLKHIVLRNKYFSFTKCEGRVGTKHMGQILLKSLALSSERETVHTSQNLLQSTIVKNILACTYCFICTNFMRYLHNFTHKFYKLHK